MTGVWREGSDGRRAIALRLLLLANLVLTSSSCGSRGPDGDPDRGEPEPVPYVLIAPVLDRSALTPVERLGYDLYLHDIAASRATDAAQAVADLAQLGVEGWIVVPHEKGLLVRYFDASGRSVVDVSVDPHSMLSPYVVVQASAPDLSPRQRAMALARRLAASQTFPLCSDRYNTVVLAESEAPDSGWLVYLLAATDDPTRIMLGGHQKFRVDPEGRTVLEHIPLSKSCLSLEYFPSTWAITTSHLVSPEPVETQVYVSLLHGIRVVVLRAERKQRWLIEGGRIQPLE